MKQDTVTAVIQCYITTEFLYAKRDSHLSAHGGVMLHRVCLGKNVNRQLATFQWVICSEMKHSAHSKEVLDDSRITEDNTSLHQHKLFLFITPAISILLRSLLFVTYSESEQYKLRDSMITFFAQRGSSVICNLRVLFTSKEKLP